MKALVINCSPVKNGAAAEIVNIISECLTERYQVKGICIDDYKFKAIPHGDCASDAQSEISSDCAETTQAY